MANNNDFSVLIGGKAGFGIDKASSIIAGILNRLGYRIYIYRDYPSLIRGGHTFSMIRAAGKKIAVHQEKADFILALNQDAVDLHKIRIHAHSVVIYDSAVVKSAGIAVPIGNIIKEEAASEIMRNSCIIGSFAKAAGIEWEILAGVFKKNISKDLDLNLKVARRGYDAVEKTAVIERLPQDALPILTGNEAIGLGLIRGGLDTYIAYPMTPSSGILHFMAGLSADYGIKVIHPESEISVMLMALGAAYAGGKVAVGTSGGGFCLMTEGLSFSGMAELPVVLVVGQRPGPSTGLPTYTAQTELHFVLHAGQGEFTRFVVAPGDAEEAYYWSAVALYFSGKYQIPAIILSDKTLAEGAYSFDINSVGKIEKESLSAQKEKGAVIKVNSYEHDEKGLTTEDPVITKTMQEKRLRKEEYLVKELEGYNAICTYGDKKSSRVILCWGSNKGVCVEVAEDLGLKAVHAQVLCPFPVEQLRRAIMGAGHIICVENNATGQFADLISHYGFKVDARILKYDGRPFTIEELKEKVRQVL